jgi:hypothetical protein
VDQVLYYVEYNTEEVSINSSCPVALYNNSSNVVIFVLCMSFIRVWLFASYINMNLYCLSDEMIILKCLFLNPFYLTLVLLSFECHCCY